MISYNFKKLTPEKNIENLTTYQEAIDYALDDEEVRNIAITGIYGSGKSSIIETYKNKTKKNRKFIHISLAHFQQIGNDKPPKNLSKNKVLEGKILNQLLHQINSSDIPQTIFKVKNTISRKKIFIWSLIFSLISLSIFYLIAFESWEKFVLGLDNTSDHLKAALNLSIAAYSRIFVFGMVFIFFIWITYTLLYTQISRKILKTISIKSKNIESNIEVFSESKDSYFDKYLDDVIYLFDRSKADVIVFEDIDRFDSNEIFSKLKEINSLVNNRKKSRQNIIARKVFDFLREVKYINSLSFIKNSFSNEKLSFIYLLKDDMFVSKDRTKFFDFIIPVIPVINSSNSYEKLKEILDKDKIFDKFDKGFLQSLSLYIDDMRLLKNICNEFIIYKGRLKDSDFLKYNNLFAMIVYKNIFPNDFAELQLNKGLVYEVFNEKKEYINKEKKKIDNKIEDIRIRIEKANNEKIKSETELYTLFYKIPEKYFSVSVDGKNLSDFNSSVEYVAALRNGQIKAAVNNGYSKTWIDVSSDQIFSEVEKNSEFIERKNVLYDKENLRDLAADIKLLEENKILLSSKKLAHFIKRNDIEGIEKKHFIKDKDSFDEIKSSDYFDLLVFILVNGYIDEGYEDYLTYFYPNSLKINDKKYLRSITDERKLEWDFNLTNKSEVYDRMSLEMFSKIEVLNYSLIKYILSDDTLMDRSDRLSRLLLMIQRENKLGFLMKFFDDDEILISALIIECNTYFPDFFLSMLKDKSFTEIEKSRVLIHFINVLNVDDLIKIDSPKKEIIIFIVSQSEFLKEIKYTSNDFLNKFKISNIKFENVEFSKVNKIVSRFIYDHDLYIINLDNICEALNLFYDEEVSKDNLNSLYTIIRKHDNEPIVKYVETNIESFLKEYLYVYNGETKDDLDYIYEILNNNKLTLDTRKLYIDTISRKDLNLSYIQEKQLWDHVVRSSILYPNASNVIDYFSFNESSWNTSLVDLVNHNKSVLKFVRPKNEDIYNDNLMSNFFNSTIEQSSLENDVYKEILRGVNRYFKKGFTIQGISKDKINILIDLRVIRFTKESLINIRELYSDNLIYFISNNIDRYLEIIDNEEIYNVDELNDVLDSNLDKSFSIQKKLVNVIKEPIQISGRDFKTNLVNYILKNKFRMDDLNTICIRYSTYSSSTRDIVYDIVIQYIDFIITNKVRFNKDLLNIVLNNKDILLIKRQLLFSRSINLFSNSELREKFILLKISNYIDLINGGGRSSFSINETNGNILSYLKRSYLISSFNEVDNIYKAYANKKKNQI